jgi:formamidopyrimidine-DNA glycosylase
MASVIFIYNGMSTSIQCSKKETMKYICEKYCDEINSNINSLIFLYGGTELNLDKEYEEYSKENKMTIFVYNKNENQVCQKCGALIDKKN